MKKLLRFFYSDKFILALAFLLDLSFFIVCTMLIGTLFYSVVSAVGIIIAIGLISRQNENSNYKMLWLLVVLAMPVFGVSLYIALNRRKGTKKQRKKWLQLTYKSNEKTPANSSVISNLEKFNEYSKNTSNFLFNVCNLPVYENTSTTYFAWGKDVFDDMLKEINKAKRFILLEFFIIKPGEIWTKLFDALRKKAREGVVVKLLYDDFGCLDRFIDKKTFKKLSNHGIEAVPFNKIKPGASLFSNYRSHRKILIIDGKIAYTGGINIADEYANIIQPFGIWKDTGIKLVGDAVWSLTVLVLNAYMFSTKQQVDILDYKPISVEKPKFKEFVQPFGSGPLDQETTYRNLYIKLINNARKYVYITTPYLILDESIVSSLKLSAKGGVDVRIIMPGVPDKKWIFYLSRSYYYDLIKAGVKIYEFTEGFVHSKMLITDDISTVIGTGNLDFRSMHLHFEDGVLIHGGPTIAKVKTDFDKLIGVCHLVGYRDLKQRKWYEKLSSKILRIFAPMF